jgi:ATP-dependent Zn protease
MVDKLTRSLLHDRPCQPRYVGVGARRIRELFAAARKAAPAIIFIDELDAIGGKRSPRDQSYVKQTLNQLLVELDGFTSGEGVILIGATNFPESLDKVSAVPLLDCISPLNCCSIALVLH